MVHVLNKSQLQLQQLDLHRHIGQQPKPQGASWYTKKQLQQLKIPSLPNKQLHTRFVQEIVKMESSYW